MVTPAEAQAAFDRRTIERIPPEYHGREDCLWRPDYSRPVEIIPPSYRTQEEWEAIMERFTKWQLEQEARKEQLRHDYAEAAVIKSAKAEDILDAIKELEKWAK